MRGARGDPERARETSITPPSAARAARYAQAGASLQLSTAAPEAWHRSAPHREQGHLGGSTREEQRLHRFTCLVLRGPPTSPLFASWPWPRHTSLLVGSSGSDSTRAAS